jgi:uncharacterized protein (DUF1778 family)
MSDDHLKRINLFRSSEEERRRWEEAALKAGLSLSEFFRQAADEKAHRMGGWRK